PRRCTVPRPGCETAGELVVGGQGSGVRTHASISKHSVFRFPDPRPLIPDSWSERQQHIEYLLAVTRLLHVGKLATAAIGDAGLCDLGRVDRVVALDVLWPHDAGDDQLADFEVDTDFLLALDHQIAVRQYLRHHGGDIGQQGFLAIDRALAVA